LEVTADDLTQVKIWMYGEHPEAQGDQVHELMPSRHLRLLAMDLLRVSGSKVSLVKKEIQKIYDSTGKMGATTRLPSGGGGVNVTYVPPVHRHLAGKQITNLMRLHRHRKRLDENPFFAVQILVNMDESRLFCYKAHDFERPESLSEFMVACTDNFSLDSLILNGPVGGWALDSSWRNKNENRAAVTFLITVNEGMHAMPGCVLLSANTRTETLVEFLHSVKIRLRQRAIDIVEGRIQIESRTDEQQATIRNHARMIADDTFEVSHFMIDKCLAELYALRQVYPHVTIRLCQFHVVQAITRWDCDNGDRGSPLQLGMEVKVQIIFLFRDLQRCRSWDEWPVEKDKFLESLRRVIMSQTEEPAEGTADSEEIAASLRPAHPNAAVPSLPTVQTKAQSAGPIGASNIKQKSSRRRARANDRPRCEVQWDYVRSYFEDNWFIEDWI
ncbi:hypothetical protein L227DRAFT_568852, partial [Lentinus tigrinus ALCF2SS1-6]